MFSVLNFIRCFCAQIFWYPQTYTVYTHTVTRKCPINIPIFPLMVHVATWCCMSMDQTCLRLPKMGLVAKHKQLLVSFHLVSSQHPIRTQGIFCHVQSEPWTRTSICGSQVLVVELSRAPCFYAGRRLHPKLLQLEPKDVAKLCSAYSHLGFQHHTVFKEALKKSPHLGGRGRNVGHPQVVSCRS
jgi:hypothetical protein